MNHLVSLGCDCLPKNIIKKLNKDTTARGPFDYLRSFKDTPIITLENNFQHFFDIIIEPIPNSTGKQFRNLTYNTFQFHDYNPVLTDQENIDQFNKHYIRRIERLQAILASNDSVTFLYKVDKDTILDLDSIHQRLLKIKPNCTLIAFSQVAQRANNTPFILGDFAWNNLNNEFNNLTYLAEWTRTTLQSLNV